MGGSTSWASREIVAIFIGAEPVYFARWPDINSNFRFLLLNSICATACRFGINLVTPIPYTKTTINILQVIYWVTLGPCGLHSIHGCRGPLRLCQVRSIFSSVIRCFWSMCRLRSDFDSKYLLQTPHLESLPVMLQKYMQF